MVIQYPHTIEIKNANTALQYKARWEYFSSSRLVNFNGQEVLVKGIAYMPLPVSEIGLTWGAKVFNEIYTGGATDGVNANIFSFKSALQLQAGITVLPGNIMFIPGANSATVTDWIGWKVIPERLGAGTMKRDVDFSWNAATGVFQLLNSGDIFGNGEWFNITFEPRINNGIIAGQQTVTDSTGALLYSAVVKQFSRGELNARVWL